MEVISKYLVQSSDKRNLRYRLGYVRRHLASRETDEARHMVAAVPCVE